MDAPGNALLLPSTLQAPERARHYLRQVGSSWPEQVLESALLVVSETVTNAVRYGRGGIRLSVEVGDESIRIEVSDANPEPPRHRTPAADVSTAGHTGDAVARLAEVGRGLYLLDALTSAWGTESRPDEPGKILWLELPLSA